jgi:hypothetical protein
VVSHLDDFRREKDEYLARDPGSPLDEDARRGFTGLDYYPENPLLVIEADLDEAVEPGEVRMATTSGGERSYRRAGIVRFEVDGTPAEITLYKSDSPHELFVPFRDAASGVETYGAGRYLEVDPPRNGRVVVDFNYAYNPFCCYDDNWSCPLPPRENWLEVAIRAGEKDFK